MPSNLDLGKWQDNPATYDAFSRLVSGGKLGYKTAILKDKPKLKCKNCGFILEGTEKFCPECGTKVIQQEDQQQEEQKDKKQNESPRPKGRGILT